MDYYLEKHDLRKQMASEAYKRTVRDHTYYERINELIKSIETKILQKRRGIK
ncbi:glycosyltransferase [Halalkalibacter kiskunsagensis]|uniref:Glycosyltransferase n=1 Tax=Halalkalibacter kiskunsagensis TaxID=1548599 RepID=A0ABV6K9Q9_9BACI